MPALADRIARYLVQLLETSGGMIELQRSVLARRFQCAPSQISYVVATRFTPAAGFAVESKRGGAGYVRIIRVNWRPDQGLTYPQAETLIERWQLEGRLTRREQAILTAIVRSHAETDEQRAAVLQVALASIGTRPVPGNISKGSETHDM